MSSNPRNDWGVERGNESWIFQPIIGLHCKGKWRRLIGGRLELEGSLMNDC